MPQAVVGFIAAIGVPGLVGAGGALTFAGNLVAGAIGLGISFAANALFGAKPSNLKPQDVKSTLRQSVLPRRKHYGTVMTSGGYAFYRSRDGGLYMVIYLGEGPTDAFLEHYIDDSPVVLDAQGYIQAKPIKGKIRIEMRKGLATETYYQSIASKFPEIWGPSHRGDGCISVAIIAAGAKQEDFNSVYPNRIPQYKGLRRDGIVRDPRTGAHTWTANLNLIYRDYLQNADGVGISSSYFDDNDFAIAADVADELLPTSGGGSERRYHGQLSYDLTTEPADIIERLETATDSRIYLKANGKIGIHPGIWVEPTIRIHDGCISSYEMSDSSGPLREANEITLEYTNPLAGYSASSCDPWRDEADISAQGTRTIPIEAYEIQNHHHGRRVQKLRYERASARWQGKIVTDLWGIQARGERRILLEIKELGIDFEPFEIEDYQEDDETMTVMMEVRSCRAGMYELSSAEEGTPPPVPPSTEDGDLDPPENVVVTSSRRAVSGSKQVAVITAEWDAYPDRDDLTAYAQISLADQNDWRPMSVAENNLKAEAIGLQDGALYDVAVEWRKAGGTPSERVIIENIKAVADVTAPDALTSFVSSDSAPRLGKALFGLTVGNDAHIETVRLYRKPSGGALDVETDLPAATLSVRPNASFNYTDGDPTRTNLLSNSGFDTDTVWTKGTGWTINSGKAVKVSGATSFLQQAAAIGSGKKARVKYVISGYSAGTIRTRLTAGSTALDDGVDRSANGTFMETVTTTGARDTFALRAASNFVGSIDDVVLYEETSTSAPQGNWDYYAVPFNGSGVAGPAAGPLAVTII